jgi:hypothetical protein
MVGVTRDSYDDGREESRMATSTPRTEQEIRDRLEELKHQMYVAKREGQLLRMELRIDLMRQKAREAVAEGRLTEDDIREVRDRHAAFSNRLRELKAAPGHSTRDGRAAVTEAWEDLQESLRAKREKAGLAKRAAAV